ncbi:SMI1/KNR4 family protein [Hyunsoonleella sp. 2307UL5-6]|uniref:SMI1/KNR4 family protein n=1 Tax=Hyunsoonleella sp. 2307UL5-6 TaxID=3384768 RepID=UPI0039BD2741
MTIEQNIDNCRFNGKIDSVVIENIEKSLGFNIPKNYRHFIENYGSGNINGFDFFGAYPNVDFENGAVLNILWRNLGDRKDYGLNPKLLLIGDALCGDYFCIDIENLNSPIYIWNVSLSNEETNNLEIIATDFDDLIEKIFNEKL